MPIPVACRCGKAFAANDNLAGKTVKCPGCQQPLQIPAPGQQGAGPAAPRPQPAGGGKIVVACACGARFAAGPELAGKQVKCPKCGQPLTVGGTPTASAPRPQATAAAAAPQLVGGLIPVTCRCGARFGAKPELHGKTVKCPKCSQPLVVGAAAPAVAAAAPALAGASAFGGGDFGLSDLLDEVGVKQKAIGENACPSCGAFLAPEAVLCVECGYNRKSGKKLQVETVKKVEAKTLGPPNAAAKAAAGKQPGSGGLSSMPWEDAAGDFGTLVSTVQAIISAPQDAFARLRPDGLKLALGYFFTTTLLIGFLAALLVGGVLAWLFGNKSLAIPGIGAAIAVAYVLIDRSISLGIFALVMHGLLKLVGGASKSIKTTLQVLAYCGGAANLLSLIPCVNTLVFLVAFYSTPVGLAAAHETSLAKSYIALVLFLVLAFALQLGLYVALEVAIQLLLPEVPQGAAG